MNQTRYKREAIFYIVLAVLCINVFFASVINSQMFGEGFNSALILAPLSLVLACAAISGSTRKMKDRKEAENPGEFISDRNLYNLSLSLERFIFMEPDPILEDVIAKIKGDNRKPTIFEQRSFYQYLSNMEKQRNEKTDRLQAERAWSNISQTEKKKVF